MQVSMEKLSSVECRLKIEVPASEVEQAYNEQINDLAKRASHIKGFRPGKAPLSLIKQRFGDDARKEALSKVILKNLDEAIKQKNLKPVNTPHIEPKLMTENQPLEFTASFEILPEIPEIKFSLDNIEKLSVDVNDSEVDHVLEQLRKQQTKWNKVDRAAQEKDRVVIDYRMILEGQDHHDDRTQNVPIELGSKIMIPGFEEGLLGAKAGEQRNLSLTFPADIADKEKAGKPVEFVVDVKDVYEAEIPNLDEQFVHRFGVKSGDLGDLKAQIKSSLEKERDRIIKDKLKEQVFKQLLDLNPLEVPNSLVGNEAKRIHDEIHPHHGDDHHHSDDEMKAFEDIAKKRVTLGLLITEYAKRKEIKPDAAKVRQRIQEIAADYEQAEEVIQWLSSDQQRSGIEAQVLEDQVLESLIENVPVTTKTMSYAELKGMRI